MYSPLVSVIVPCYNQSQFLSEALESVIAQAYQNWECVIVNDGSTDETQVIGEKYCQKDSRITYSRKENGGLSSARNFGIVKSHGQYILPLDCDDKISEDYLQLAVPILESDPTIKFVYSKATFFGSRTDEWKLPPFDYERFIYENMIFCTGLYRRVDYDNTGGYKTTLKKGLEDWDFLLSLIHKEDKVFRIEKTCFYYRQHKSSMTATRKINDHREAYKIIYQNHREIYDEYIDNPLFLQIQNNQLSILADKLQDDLKSSLKFRFLKIIKKHMRSIKKMMIEFLKNKKKA